jgi:hypothetical protein
MRRRAARYFFRDPCTDVSLEAHMDDCYVTGLTDHVNALTDKFSSLMKIRVGGPFGPGDAWTHSRRKRAWTKEGIVIRSDPSYLTKLQLILGFNDCNSNPAPSTKDCFARPQRTTRSRAARTRASIETVLS